MANDKLIFPIGFDLENGVREAQKGWKTYRSQLQKTIDRNPLKVKLELLSKDLNTTDLKEYIKLSREVAKANKNIAKARLDNARAEEVEARSAGKTAIQREQQRAAAARAEQAELRLAQAKKRSVNATHAQNAAYKTQTSYIDRLIKRLAVVGGLYQAASFVRNIRDVTAEFELQRVALGAIIKDSQGASKMFEQIKEAAVKSPFEIKDLVRYTKELAAYKFETKDLFSTTMQLADISAGLGVEMGRLVLALGQVRATGHLRASEVRQFTEAGIPLVEELAKKMSVLRGEMVSAGDVMQMISERAISFGMVKEVFDDMTSAGGAFYQMQEKQAETLRGQWTNLKDSISIMYDEMGRGAAINSVMTGTIGIIKSMATNWEYWSSVVSNSITMMLLYMAAQKKWIPIQSIQNRSIWANIKAEKAQEAQRIRALAVGRDLTDNEQRRLALTKKLRAADYERFIAEKKMTDQQLVRYAMSNRNNKQIMLAIRNTKRLTAEQLANIQSMSRWQIFTTKLNMTFRALGASFKALGSAMLSFWPLALISGVTELISGFISQSMEQKKAIGEVRKAFEEKELELERIETAYRAVQKAASKASKSDKDFANNTYGEKLEQLQKIAEMLEKYNLANAIDFSVVNAENIDAVFETWLLKIREVNTLSESIGINLAKVANAQEFTLFGWSLGGENLKEDMEDFTEEWADMVTDTKFRKELERMRVYVNKMAVSNDKWYNKLSEVVGMDAKLALSAKKRNESDLQYYERVIKAYEKIQKLSTGGTEEYTGFDLSRWGVLGDFKKIDFVGLVSAGKEVMREIDKIKDSFAGKDPLSIRMALDEQFALNGWKDWQKEYVINELNKERLSVGLELIPQIAPVVETKAKTGIQSILETEFAGLFSKDELEKIIDPTTAVEAIEGKVKSSLEKIETLNKASLNATLENGALAVEKVETLQREIQAELAKDEKDINHDLIASNNAQIFALTQQQKEYEKQLETKREMAQAEYDLAKAAKQRFVNENLSSVAKDVSTAFPQLIVDELTSLKGAIGEELMITSKDLIDIKDIGDLYDVWAKKVKAIADEKTKLAKVGLSEETLLAEQAKYDQERSNISNQIAQSEQILNDLQYQGFEDKLQQLTVEKNLATTAAEREDIQSKINALMADERYKTALQVAITKNYLKEELKRKNIAAEANEESLKYISALTAVGEMLKQLGERWNFKLIVKGKDADSQQDEWILLYKNRMSYMQDFQKGVANLSKFMLKDNALQQEQLIMLNRGMSLGIDSKKLTGSREELLKWYDDAIKAVQKKIHNLGGKEWSGLGVEAILSKDTKNRVIKKYQELLQEIFNQMTDFQTNELQSDLENKLARLAEDIAQTKAAKEFYNRILGLTGDQDLSATFTLSVYGQTGTDLAKKTVEEIEEVFKGVDVSSAINYNNYQVNWNKLAEIYEKYNANILEANRKAAKNLITTAQDVSAKQIEQWAKDLEQVKSYADKRVDIANQTAQRIAEIEQSNIPQMEKDKLIQQYREKEAEDVSQLEYDTFKNSPTFVSMFENLDRVSLKMLNHLRTKVKEMQNEWQNLDVTQLKELQSRLEAIDKEITERNPFKALANSMKELKALREKGSYKEAKHDLQDKQARYDTEKENLKEMIRIRNEVKAIYDQMVTQFGLQNPITLSMYGAYQNAEKNLAVQKQTTNEAEKQIDTAQELVDTWEDSKSTSKASVREIFRQMDDITQSLGSAAKDIAEAFNYFGGGDAEKELFNSITEGTTGLISAASSLAMGITTGNPAAIISGVGQAVKSISTLATSGDIYRSNKVLEKQIKLLEDLSYAYSRLEKAQEEALGSEYVKNYAEMMKVLVAEEQANRYKVQAERDKGKNADSKKVEEYEKQWQESADAIKDAYGSLSEYMLGSSLATTAKDFARTWIDAKKSFGDTAEAIEDRMSEMIENMIVDTILAEGMKKALEPVFTMIDNASTTDLYSKTWWNNLLEVSKKAVTDANVVGNNLWAMIKDLGIDISSAGEGLTGIAKDVATASEESILGLAAGINTQNFYISQIYANVALITQWVQSGGAGLHVNVSDLITMQNQYLSNLPNIAANTANTLTECRSILTAVQGIATSLNRVIQANGTKASYSVRTTM